MQLFYSPEITKEQAQFTFSKEESKHIIKVLRKTNGDVLKITNGKGDVFTAQISQANEKHCVITIVSSETQNPLPYHLHLAVAPTKMNDRYEWFLEKATEIGVTEITPVLCEHSERKVVKIERFEKILQAAMKQSLQCYLPKLNDAMAYKDFIKQTFKGDLFIAHCEETNRKSLKKELKPGKDITILIGPEGDFSKSEIALAIAQGFQPVTLGDTRLRTETAAVVGCHSVAFVNEG